MAANPRLKPEQVETTAPITGEALFRMGDLGRTELVRGEIIYMSPTGHLHGYVEGEFYSALKTFVTQHQLGRVLVGEVGVYTGRNPDTVRGADVVFISHERMAQVKSKSYLDVAPELIVEILSPDDSWSEVMDKLEEYFNIGVLAVWVADPRKQQVYIYQSLTDVQRFTMADALPGGQVLPGFSVPVSELLAAR
jgi:Uma2 family endonuclease